MPVGLRGKLLKSPGISGAAPTLPTSPVLGRPDPMSAHDEAVRRGQDKLGIAPRARPISPNMQPSSPGGSALEPSEIVQGQARALDTGVRTLRGRLVEKITVTRPTILYPIDVLATGGSFFQTVGVNGGFGVDASPNLARGSGLVFHSPNRIDQAAPTANAFRSVGSGVVYLYAPGDWYLYYDVPFVQATATGLLTYLMVDAINPEVANWYLKLPGIHYFNQGTVTFTGTEGAMLSSTNKSYRDRKAITFVNASASGDAAVPIYLQPYYNKAPPTQNANEGYPLFPSVAASPSGSSVTFQDSTLCKAAFTERVEGATAAKLYCIEYY
jgi:hypothetical protein